jgi:hypothetical protein
MTMRPTGAQHVTSKLMRESLMDRAVIAGTETKPHAIRPILNVIQIGGLSIMDKGQSAVLPLLDEIVANQAEHTQVIGVGPRGAGAAHPVGGARSRAADRRAGHARRQVGGAECLHDFLPAGEPGLRLSRGAVHRAVAAGHAGGGARRGVQRRAAIRFVGTSAGTGETAAARQRRRILSGRRGVRRPQVILLKDVDGLYTADPKMTRTLGSFRRSARRSCWRRGRRPCRSSWWCWTC